MVYPVQLKALDEFQLSWNVSLWQFLVPLLSVPANPKSWLADQTTVVAKICCCTGFRVSWTLSSPLFFVPSFVGSIAFVQKYLYSKNYPLCKKKFAEECKCVKYTLPHIQTRWGRKKSFLINYLSEKLQGRNIFPDHLAIEASQCNADWQQWAISCQNQPSNLTNEKRQMHRPFLSAEKRTMTFSFPSFYFAIW